MTYRFPEQLRFKHLKTGELFCLLPAGGHWSDAPVAGPYRKVSPRRFVPVQVRTSGLRVIADPISGAPVWAIDSVNAPVTDALHHLVGF